jgi:hypothetical protein
MGVLQEDANVGEWEIGKNLAWMKGVKIETSANELSGTCARDV